MNDDQTTPTNNNSGGIFGSPMNMQNTQSTPIAQDEKAENEQIVSDTFSTPVNDKNLVSDSFALPTEENKKDSVVEENNTTLEEEKHELQDLGMTVVDGQPSQETNIFDSNSSFPVSQEKKSEESTDTKEDSIVTKALPEIVETKDLEKDFSETFSVDSDSEQVLEEVSLDVEEEKLKKMHDKLKEKADHEKTLIKKELEDLKKEKEKIGKRLETVKELESLASSIQEKLQSLEKIDNDIDSLEKKAQASLQ